MPHHSKQQRPSVTSGGSFPPPSNSSRSLSGLSPHSNPGPPTPHLFRARGNNMMPPPGISASLSMPPGSSRNHGGVVAPPPPLHHHPSHSFSPGSSGGGMQHQHYHQSACWMSKAPSHIPQLPPPSYQQPTQHGQTQGIHRVPITPLKGDDSSKDGGSLLLHTNSVSSSSREGSPPMMMKQHSRSKSFESHEIAASVLLLASSIRDSQRNARYQHNASVGSSSSISKCHEDGDDDDCDEGQYNSNSANTQEESSRPLKKRKKVTDIIMRTKINGDEHPFHVSPMSGQASPAGVPGGVAGESNNTSSNTPSSSYEFQDALTKVSSSSTSTPEHNVLIMTHPHLQQQPLTGGSNHSSSTSPSVAQDFPVILHKVLSDAEFGDNVVKWLPDGKSWKIVRWDALRRQVLPKYFPLLNSIDAFLCNLQRWGFTEITEGPDAGAYSHMFFRRGHIDLCSEMTCKNPIDACNSESRAHETMTSNAVPSISRKESGNGRRYGVDHSRSILRVPSLASTSGSLETHRTSNNRNGVGDSDTIGAQAIINNTGKTDYSSITGVGSTPQGGNFNGNYLSWRDNHGRFGGSGTGPIFVNFRPEEMSLAEQHQQQQTQFHWNYSVSANAKQMNWMRGGVGGPISGGSGPAVISHQQHHPAGMGTPPSPPTASPVTMRGMPPYSPIRIRSSRGAHRNAAPAGGRSTSDGGMMYGSVGPLPARTFPVSNRGMGRRPIPPNGIQRTPGGGCDQPSLSNDELQMFKKDTSSQPSDATTLVTSDVVEGTTHGGSGEQQCDSMVNPGCPVAVLKKRDVQTIGDLRSSSEEEKKAEQD